MKWVDNFDHRHREEIAFANMYAKGFNHGTDGHHRLIIISKMSDILDEYQKILNMMNEIFKRYEVCEENEDLIKHLESIVG